MIKIGKEIIYWDYHGIIWGKSKSIKEMWKLIIKKHEPEIQLLKETVDIYFSVEFSEDDERIQKYDLDPKALSVWVSFQEGNTSSPFIDLADGGVSVLGVFPFSDGEIADILQHIEETKKKIEWKTQNTPMQFQVDAE